MSKEVIIRLNSDHIKVKGGQYVRDLVRCRDCKYLEVHGKTTMHYWCDQWEHYTDEDSFCSYGEREGE